MLLFISINLHRSQTVKNIYRNITNHPEYYQNNKYSDKQFIRYIFVNTVSAGNNIINQPRGKIQHRSRSENHKHRILTECSSDISAVKLMKRSSRTAPRAVKPGKTVYRARYTYSVPRFCIYIQNNK